MSLLLTQWDGFEDRNQRFKWLSRVLVKFPAVILCLINAVPPSLSGVIWAILRPGLCTPPAAAAATAASCCVPLSPRHVRKEEINFFKQQRLKHYQRNECESRLSRGGFGLH